MTETFFTHLPLPNSIIEHSFKLGQKVIFNTKDTIPKENYCIKEGVVINISDKRDYTGKIKITVEAQDKNEYQIFPGLLKIK